jgi:hypothetical protein
MKSHEKTQQETAMKKIIKREVRIMVKTWMLFGLLGGVAQAQCPFHERDYLAYNPDVQAAVLRGNFTSGQDHYYRHGVHENRAYNMRCGPVSFKPYCPFVESEYVEFNHDVAAAIHVGSFRSGADHFKLHGYSEDRILSRECAQSSGRGGRGRIDPPHCDFNERDYLAFNPDVQAAVFNGNYSSGRDHYYRFGIRENREVNRACARRSAPLYCPFVEHEYLELNSDVAYAVSQGRLASGRDHFIRHGHAERRLLSYECAREERRRREW